MYCIGHTYCTVLYIHTAWYSKFYTLLFNEKNSGMIGHNAIGSIEKNPCLICNRPSLTIALPPVSAVSWVNI